MTHMTCLRITFALLSTIGAQVAPVAPVVPVAPVAPIAPQPEVPTYPPVVPTQLPTYPSVISTRPTIPSDNVIVIDGDSGEADDDWLWFSDSDDEVVSDVSTKPSNGANDNNGDDDFYVNTKPGSADSEDAESDTAGSDMGDSDYEDDGEASSGSDMWYSDSDYEEEDGPDFDLDWAPEDAEAPTGNVPWPARRSNGGLVVIMNGAADSKDVLKSAGFGGAGRGFHSSGDKVGKKGKKFLKSNKAANGRKLSSPKSGKTLKVQDGKKDEKEGEKKSDKSAKADETSGNSKKSKGSFWHHRSGTYHKTNLRGGN